LRKALRKPINMSYRLSKTNFVPEAGGRRADVGLINRKQKRVNPSPHIKEIREVKRATD